MKIKSYIKKLKGFKTYYTFYSRVTHFIFKGHIFKYFHIKKLVSSSKPIKLQIGGNKFVIKDENWVNGDILAGDIYLNANKPLPFPDSSIDYIFAEQFIEHITLEKARTLLSEAYRVLRSGGVIRLATPDMNLLYRTYLNENELVSIEEAIDRHKAKHNPQTVTACNFFNDYFRYWGHKFIYDYETLSKILIEAGFTDVKRYSYGESDHKELMGRERHAENYEWMKNAWQLIVEAQKK